MRPRQFAMQLVAEFESQTRPLQRNGVDLSQSDAATTKEVYTHWVALLSDCSLLSPSECRIRRHIIRDIMSIDVMDMLNSHAEFLALVLSNGQTGFKALSKKISPHLWSVIRPTVEEHLQGIVSSTSVLIQLFSYVGRLSLRDIDLTTESIEAYVAVENGITGREAKTSIIPALRSIIQRWCKGIDVESSLPQHGPGGTAGLGRSDLDTKYRNLAHDQRSWYAFRQPFSNYSNFACQSSRVSQTIFVAKNYKSFRTISMEPVTLQYLQQQVWHAIDEKVQRYSYLRSRIGFHEQERNQQLAKEGSFSREYATIDLSAASDSVTWQLVKALFGGTKLFRYLFATRSTHTVLPDGTFLELKKFAPMGSALCFPIETLIFASICEFVTMEHGVAGDYSVFGDDIIVPTRCVQDVIHCLELSGFSVNTDKSFTSVDSPFRESCGGEYWNGIDVTPMRISRKYTSRYFPKQYQALVSGCNAAYAKGFSYLRQLYLLKLRELRVVPYFSPAHVQGPSYSNYHAKERYNKSLQRFEVRVTQLHSKSASRRNDVMALDHWLQSNRDRDIPIEEPFVARMSKPTVYAKESWADNSLAKVSENIETQEVLTTLLVSSPDE